MSNNNHDNQIEIHSHYGSDLHAVEYIEIYDVANPHVLCMEDDIQIFVKLMLIWISLSLVCR